MLGWHCGPSDGCKKRSDDLRDQSTSTSVTLSLFLAVAAGGLVGAPSRYLLDRAITRRASSDRPWGTFVINVTGSLLLGFLTGLTLTGHLSGIGKALLGYRLLRRLYDILDVHLRDRSPDGRRPHLRRSGERCHQCCPRDGCGSGRPCDRARNVTAASTGCLTRPCLSRLPAWLACQPLGPKRSTRIRSSLIPDATSRVLAASAKADDPHM